MHVMSILLLVYYDYTFIDAELQPLLTLTRYTQVLEFVSAYISLIKTEPGSLTAAKLHLSQEL